MKLRAWLAACGSIYLIASIIREDCEVVSDLSGFKIMRDQNLELNDFSTGVLESKQISIKKTSLAEDEDSSLLVSACNFLHINWLTVLKKTLCILPFNAVRYTFNTVSILGSTGSQFNLGQNLFSGHAEFFFFLPRGYSYVHSPLEVLDIWQPTCLRQSCAFRNRTPIEQIRNERLKCKFTKATTI